MERLIGNAHIRMKKKTPKTAASITILTWLDELYDLEGKILRGKTTDILMSSATPEELREAGVQFKRKITTARGTALRRDKQGVGEQAVDTSTEEPPDS